MVNKSRKKAKQEAEAFPRKTILVHAGKTEKETCRNHAGVTTSPELAAFRVIHAVELNSELGKNIDVPIMLEVLRDQVKAVHGGDLKQAEAMLMNQATALQSLFARLTEKAMGAEYMSNFEGFMRAALRAQSQCRATLETLSAIKNPPIVYTKQANISHGHQQVNNGSMALSQAREIENKQTQLSGGDYELSQNTGTPGIAKQDDSPLETLGEIDRAKIPRR